MSNVGVLLCGAGRQSGLLLPIGTHAAQDSYLAAETGRRAEGGGGVFKSPESGETGAPQEFFLAYRSGVFF